MNMAMWLLIGLALGYRWLNENGMKNNYSTTPKMAVGSNGLQ
jgi:hypothetical protein